MTGVERICHNFTNMHMVFYATIRGTVWFCQAFALVELITSWESLQGIHRVRVILFRNPVVKKGNSPFAQLPGFRPSSDHIVVRVGVVSIPKPVLATLGGHGHSSFYVFVDWYEDVVFKNVPYIVDMLEYHGINVGRPTKPLIELGREWSN